MKKLLILLSLFLSLHASGQRLTPGIVASSGVTAAPSTGLLTGLLAYYSFEEASGNAIDLAGTNDGTTTDVTYSQTGKIGNCYSYNGTSSKVQIPAFIIAGNKASISVWARLDAVDALALIVGRYWGQFQMGNVANYATAKWLNVVASDNNPTSSSWAHYVLTYDGSLGSNNLKIYINGNLEGQANVTGDNTENDEVWQIGANGSNQNYWTGVIDECGFWNIALTPEQIALLYNSGSGLIFSAF